MTRPIPDFPRRGYGIGAHPDAGRDPKLAAAGCFHHRPPCKQPFPHPYTASDAEHWIRQATEATPQTHFAIANPVETIRGIGLDLQTDVFHIR